MPRIITARRGSPGGGGGGSNFVFNSGFSGSVSAADGGPFTVNGTNFGTKPNSAKCVLYASLASSLAPDAANCRYSSTPTGDPSDTVATVGGYTGMRVDARAENVASPMLYQELIDLTTGGASLTGKVYCFVKNYKTFFWGYYGPSGDQQGYVSDKSFRLNVDQGASGVADAWWGADTGVSVDGVDTGGNVFYDGVSGGLSIPVTVNAWMTREHFWDSGTLNNTDGIRNYCQDGILGYPTTYRFKNITSAYPGLMKQVNLDEFTSTAYFDTSVLIGYDFYRRLYLDDSPKRVMHSTENGSLIWDGTGGSAGREICLISSWSDTQVQGTVLQGDAASFSGRRLQIYTDHFDAVEVGHWP